MDLVIRAESSRDGPDVWIVNGDIADPNLPAFEEAFDQVAAESKGDVILDMSGVERMDSTGLGQLAMLYKRTRGRGAKLILRHPRPFVLDVLRATSMDRLLVVEE